MWKGFSISKKRIKKPPSIKIMERKTVLLAISMKASPPKTWPKEETIHSPVEVTTQKI